MNRTDPLVELISDRLAGDQPPAQIGVLDPSPGSAASAGNTPCRAAQSV
ncbi:hypothetical protein [Micromonospora sp. NPDC005367]